jgi:hypothetical protein
MKSGKHEMLNIKTEENISSSFPRAKYVSLIAATCRCGKTSACYLLTH